METLLTTLLKLLPQEKRPLSIVIAVITRAVDLVVTKRLLESASQMS